MFEESDGIHESAVLFLWTLGCFIYPSPFSASACTSGQLCSPPPCFLRSAIAAERDFNKVLELKPGHKAATKEVGITSVGMHAVWVRSCVWVRCITAVWVRCCVWVRV